MNYPDSSDETLRYYPFFDPYRDGKPLSWVARLGIAFFPGVIYSLLQILSLEDKSSYLHDYSWVLSIIMSTSLAALYVATYVFRESLQTLLKFEAGSGITRHVIENLATRNAFLLFALTFGTANTLVVHVLGLPLDLQASSYALSVSYVGHFMAGFCAGLGLWAIFSVINLYLRFAPDLQFTLEPLNPDGAGGIKLLGESLWFFGMLIAVVGLLVAGYMFSVEWTNLRGSLAATLFLIWLAMPFTVAISVVLIPSLAVRRQVEQFKERRLEELKRRRAEVYAAFKNFSAMPDDDIIAGKRSLNEELQFINKQIDMLEQMRSSPLDGRGSRKAGLGKHL